MLFAFSYNNVMLPAWSEAPDSRPSFDDICATLDRDYGQTQEGYYYDGKASVTSERLSQQSDFYDDGTSGGPRLQAYGHYQAPQSSIVAVD